MSDIRTPQNPGIGGLDELTLSEELTIQNISGLGDPGADRILFWDDSAGAFAYLTAGSGLTITGTTITAAGAALSGTANEIAYFDTTTSVASLTTATYPSLTELAYVKGVTSAIQTQFGTKASTALNNLASVAINTTLVSDTDNTDALGTAAIGWSDIYLGSGAVITWSTAPSTADVTLTHSANLLTLDGGNLSLGTGSLIAHSFLGDATDGALIEAANGTDVAIFGAGNTANTSLLGAVTIAGAVLPSVDNTPALGATGQAWSDLWLGDGAVINFNAGDITLTHSLNTLTLGGGDLALGTNNLTMTGSLAATGSRVTKGWFTDIESTNMPTVGGTAILTSLTAPQFTTIELGHASDTTLSRVSAGVVAIEGVNILTTAGGTLTGNLTLGENTSVALDPAGSADGKYTGITVTGTAGYTQAFGDLVYLAVADSRWELADADASATAGPVMLAMVVSAGTDGNACTLLLQGIIRADAKFPTMTVGATQYVGETAGEIQGAIPTGADNIIRTVGYALTADELYFNPSTDWQVTVA